jgi:chloramphenicol-sensitive protein RarD
VSNNSRSIGVIYGILAYLAWGLLPIYWKQVETASADEILSHRIVWSLAFVALILSLQRGWKNLWKICRSSRAIAWAALSGALIATNWFLYIWAVISSHIVETSFGYYLTPLANVLVGALILREHLRPLQIGEPVTVMDLVGFGFIWVALALYTSESLLHHRPRRIIPSAPVAPGECPESSG